ncbi:MAG TPA: hypothetical protein VI259_12220 [Gemmatimonadaceae bacterium]
MNHSSVRLAVRRSRTLARPTIAAAALLVAASGSGGAQLVTPKTVAIHRDDQFAIFPSSYAGMAGGAAALDDTLADPFSNPARASAIRHSSMFFLPFAHNVSAGRGGGSTYPVGGAASSGAWAGVGVYAAQRLNELPTTLGDPASMGSNQYASGALARRFKNDLSLGLSAYRAKLSTMDESDLLFTGSDQLLQSGSVTDVRLGLTKKWGERRLDAVLLTNRTDVSQDVHYTVPVWSPPDGWRTSSWSDHSIDKTTIWGAHTQYTLSAGDGWQVAWVGTFNHLGHPDIPNYRIQGIPHDPGSTNAFNLGVSTARVTGHSTFAFEAVLEPMYSKTWGTAVGDTAVVGGGSLHAGDHTVDNRFTFSNMRFRFGGGRDFHFAEEGANSFGFQYGLSMYAINYRLRQDDHVQQSSNTNDQTWVEWTPTLGLSLTVSKVTWRYNYRRTCGPSTCIDLLSGEKVTIPPSVTPGGVVAAPVHGANVNGGVVGVHQLMVMVPIG